jgi:D-alanine--D-alanine ligase
MAAREGNRNFTVGIICGGPSRERGISLNSARSAVDHMGNRNVKAKVFYINQNLNFFSIDKKQLYSNTPSDFDFKLAYSNDRNLSESDFIEKLKETNIVFPLVHGKYGEDGTLQSLLENSAIPFLGSSSESCRLGFDKRNASSILSKNGFYIFPSINLRKNIEENEKIIERFFDLNGLRKAVVKPSDGGSSIGVHCVYSSEEAIEKMKLLFSQGDSSVVVEPFCVGREFSIIVIQNLDSGQPVALMPTEIEMNYENYQIFDYRRKYLPTAQTRFYTPARFRDEDVKKIRLYSEEIFTLMNFRDVVRIDGWLLNDRRIWFSDINIVPGMEQNSFVFQQASRIGMTHGDFIRHLLESACHRYGIDYPDGTAENKVKRRVNVIFGGSNAERQVSLMSGTNIWLKLLKSEKYFPVPYILDKNGDVWHLPYAYTLNHTVEEIYENVLDAEINSLKTQELANSIGKELGLDEYTVELPIKYSFEEFMKITREENAFVFLGLHGGIGEDGTIQRELYERRIKYNGSDERSSSLCMDKYATAIAINNLEDSTLRALPKVKFMLNDFIDYSLEDYRNFWEKVEKELDTNSFIVKPCRDGSSAGVVKICSIEDFRGYLALLKEKVPFIPKNTFKDQTSIIEMPSNNSQCFLLETFIEVDTLSVRDNKIVRTENEGWLELTVGVIEQNGVYHSFNPSIAVAENKILTIEEKFQGGTGINITPPPPEIVDGKFIEIIKANVENSSKVLGIKNYGRLDIFANTKTQKVLLIEANTLPALTPSTVIFHQALEEKESLSPENFLEKIIEMREL